ncbi:MAG: methyltransferase domain-containing protein [Bdellovibrionales bacterium]
MFTDIIELREFYQSPRGQTAAAMLAPVLQRHMPSASGTAVLYGYAPPSVFSTLPVAVLMPATQGISSWPDAAGNRAALVEEATWPLPEQSCDTVILMHALEACADPHAVLRECWRVLKGQGRLVMVVPNRRGLWARAESTPFGRGQPFTATQLRHALRSTQFVAERWERAVFVPPFKSGVLLKAASLCERVGRALLPTFGGLLVMSAAKQLYAPTGRAAPAKPVFSFIPSNALPTA